MKHAKHLTSAKAKKIMRDGMVRGHKLTKKQMKFMGAIAGGERPRRKKVRRTKR